MPVRYPEGHVLLRNLAKTYPIIARGDGVYLFDDAGKRYFDASGGALVNSVGHGNKEIAAKVGAQLAEVAYVNGMQFTSAPTEALASKLCARAPKGLDRAFFLSSGSEAIEAAAKFVRQLWVERGKPERDVFIARSPGYHGNTLFALAASARPHYKKFFGPLLADVVMIESPYEYRAPVKDYAREGGAYYADQLARAIEKVGAHRVAGFFAEPVIGSSAGASVPPPDYFSRVTDICHQHGVLMVADEVMCGAGRTGAFFASEHFAWEPDLLVMGKGLNSGYAPLSAVLVRDAHVREMQAGSGGFMHAQTYMQAPCMTAVGLAVYEYIEKNHLVESSRELGKRLHAGLREVLLPLPFVGNVAGLGLFAGIELVEDKATKRPFPRARKIVEALVQHCFDHGLVVWPNVGHAGGTDGAGKREGGESELDPTIIVRLAELAVCRSLWRQVMFASAPKLAG